LSGVMARSVGAQPEVNVKRSALESDSHHKLSELLPGDDNLVWAVAWRLPDPQAAEPRTR
jgi:hypothetical protein